ncbi:MAG: restriction endonuclease [Candidatus Cloacimonetes bacterium]|nr:restriction endonuclease [Candidatus Cloacimonadota bacterium]
MPVMVDTKKWIFYKHTNNYEIIQAIALDVKNSCKTEVSELERYRMQERQHALDLYNTRNPTNRPLDSMNHRINTLEYYMFGYEDINGGNKRFIFSPLGNLFLKHINNPSNLQQIFTTMLFGIQLEHPANNPSSYFQLYPFRLIFQLLLDSRLDYKLNHFEEALLLPFIRTMNDSEYENLVSKILKLRQKSVEEIKELLLSDEHLYVNTVYEWQYYVTGLLVDAGVLNKEEGDPICTLYHPVKKSGTVPTKRIAKLGYVSLRSEVIPLLKELFKTYSISDPPVNLRDSTKLRMDAVKEVYSFYPTCLLKRIGESETISELLELPRLINKYSLNGEHGDCYGFERILAKGFEQFYNVEVKLMGGAGHTDIECLFMPKKKKFDVEAKSTSNKLTGINAGRLRLHRKEIGSKYTIVVTPRYTPSVVEDIAQSETVIILANTLAEFLYNHIFADIREIDYTIIDDIIEPNLGTDISEKIHEYTMSAFAAKVETSKRGEVIV